MQLELMGASLARPWAQHRKAVKAWELTMADGQEKRRPQLGQKAHPNAEFNAATGAVVALISDVYCLLVEKEVISQADAIARLEAMTWSIRDDPAANQAWRSTVLGLMELVRHALANEITRKPS